MRRLLLGASVVAALSLTTAVLALPHQGENKPPRIAVALSEATTTSAPCPAGTTLGDDGLCHGACPIYGTTTCRDTPTTEPPTTTVPEPPPTTAAPSPPPPSPKPEQVAWPVSLQPCGGDLPPCWVKDRESHGDYSARNNSDPGSACGAWQIIGSTWAGFGGYVDACSAPPAVQDEKARQLWAGGAGCSHWSAC